ncbi:MAG TPA: chitobiase/beta-hexosaminidase C-terminal domain-containing protein [Spirochaetota bacterium]
MRKIFIISLLALCSMIQIACWIGNKSDPDPVVDPVFSPPSGTYSSDQSVSILCPTMDATIYYTTDGTSPTTSSPIFDAGTPIPVTGNGTVKTLQAFAVKSGMADSKIISASYVINWINVSAPTFTPLAGNYPSSVTVTIGSATSGATIYYTTDGITTPTQLSSVFTSGTPIIVPTGSMPMTIQAYAIKQGLLDSAIITAVYKYGAACGNGSKDINETDVDCGGVCGTKCQPGQGCNVNADCTSGHCTATVCQP